jgi:ADP-heptose:LPS heptosyltransferase
MLLIKEFKSFMGNIGYKGQYKIAVLRPLQFGDLMCAVPAFRALRAAYPEADVTLIGLPWASIFVERFHKYIDHLLEFPGFPGFPEQDPRIDEFPGFLVAAQKQHFDLALQMQGSGLLSNSIIAMLGAKQTAGYFLEGSYYPDAKTFIDYPVGEHEIWRHLKLLQHLGIALQGDYLEFPIFDTDRKRFQDLQEEFGLTADNYVVIHPGARDEARRWAPEKFAAVSDQLSEYGFRLVLTGTTDESAVTRAVISKASRPLVDLTGRTDYGTMAVLLSKASLLVSNDTGVSHLAAALEVPSVILFSGSEPERWGPINQNLHRRVLWASAAQSSAVIHEAEKLLLKEQTYAA